MVQKLRVEASGMLLWALAILTLPMDWLGAVMVAVGVHELGHYLCARILGIRVYSVSISAAGCRMETEPMTRMQEFFCALSGPCASLLLALLKEWTPISGFCGLVQGLFNLLPVYPMDGGRILRCLAGERPSKIISLITALCLGGMGAYLTIFQNMGPIPLFFGFVLVIRSGITKKFLQTG